jgi:hypothetical protein
METATINLPTTLSAEQTSHILSQSATWSPSARLYLQGAFTYVLDALESPASAVAGVGGLVQDALNDYWNTSVTTGYALDNKTDLQTTYSYYRANNFADNSLFSQPYGADAEEHNLTTAIVHRLRKNLTCTLKYGFFKGMDHTFGGHNSYEAHMVYSSWQYRF